MMGMRGCGMRLVLRGYVGLVAFFCSRAMSWRGFMMLFAWDRVFGIEYG